MGAFPHELNEHGVLSFASLFRPFSRFGLAASRYAMFDLASQLSEPRFCTLTKASKSKTSSSSSALTNGGGQGSWCKTHQIYPRSEAPVSPWLALGKVPEKDWWQPHLLGDCQGEKKCSTVGNPWLASNG